MYSEAAKCGPWTERAVLSGGPTVERPSERHLKAISTETVWCWGDGGHRVSKWGDLWMMVHTGWICGFHLQAGELKNVARLATYRRLRDGF